MSEAAGSLWGGSQASDQPPEVEKALPLPGRKRQRLNDDASSQS